MGRLLLLALAVLVLVWLVRRALRGQPVRCALMFGELAVEDLLPRRKGRPRPGKSAARGSHRGGPAPRR